MMASDLFGFNDKPFSVNHQLTDLKQSDNKERALSFLRDLVIQLSVIIGVLPVTDTNT